MKGKGQYVYAHVFASKDASSGDSGAEPLFKFNNGHFGGSNACVSQEHASLANGNAFAGSCMAAIKPKLLELQGSA